MQDSILGSLGRIPLGIIADRYGGRRTFTILLVILLAPTALAGLADSYGALLGVSFFLGLAGTAFAIGAPFVARWFPPAQQGLALGIYGGEHAGQGSSGPLTRLGWATPILSPRAPRALSRARRRGGRRGKRRRERRRC